MNNNQKITVLLADELALVREGIARLCEGTHRFTTVDQCSDGESALQVILATQPELAVVDFHLPRLFSLELIRKAREAGVTTRFLVLAARGDRKMALEALRCGANGFLLKSAPASQLVEALTQVSSGSIYVSPELQFERIFISPRREQPEDPIESLSSREYQVFRLLVDGIRAKEIAARLDLSPKTVDTYRASLMRKLDIHDVAGLVKFAIQRDITSLSPNGH
jgi:DNA-binding NarL/FixJ family response regulator